MHVRTFSYLSEVSSSEFFSQILNLTTVEWLRASVLQGYVTCAGGGTETTVRSSRDALVAFIETQKSHDVICMFFKSLLQVLEDHGHDDRYVITTLEMLGFIIDSGLISSDN